jgi:hypothetical protein
MKKTRGMVEFVVGDLMDFFNLFFSMLERTPLESELKYYFNPGLWSFILEILKWPRKMKLREKSFIFLKSIVQ